MPVHLRNGSSRVAATPPCARPIATGVDDGYTCRVKLLRLAFWLCVLAMFVWFGTSVSLGKRTLFGHLHAIFATEAAQDLVEGTKEEARKVGERVREELRSDGGAASAPPRERLDDRDRRALDELVKKKLEAAAR